MELRIALDASLGRLAHLLRFLGYDVVIPEGTLEDVFTAAARDRRLVVTPSHRRPARHGSVPAITVPRQDPAAALRIVVAHGPPGMAPFTRCVECNAGLAPEPAGHAADAVPERVARAHAVLHHCPECGRWFWEGSHVARVRAGLEAALGRQVRSG